ncbi:Fur family transcriptional regulator [Spiroplasma gladiatoris]|uniref:Fur family transcriptional regulator n=1 Tax=Spiroplasma gladiatoris TaxID=2143 RepID=A0A4P7AIJ4_9MOLU|nr:transcriptional repressor [Spiroplasma gladiatoris]QBQ08082.1 Fur family transcriptional regulator [Spiroplasma gladiatoris]
MSDELYKEYISTLKQNKIKITFVRQCVLKIVASRKHFTISELIAELEMQMGSVNVMSIYNNIDLLLNLNLLFANSINGKQIVYEAVAPKLIHINCYNCKKFEHIDYSSIDEKVTETLKPLMQSAEFKLDYFKLDVYGTCKDCKK